MTYASNDHGVMNNNRVMNNNMAQQAGRFSAQHYREAMGPGYQVATFDEQNVLTEPSLRQPPVIIGPLELRVRTRAFAQLLVSATLAVAAGRFRSLRLSSRRPQTLGPNTAKCI